MKASTTCLFLLVGIAGCAGSRPLEKPAPPPRPMVLVPAPAPDDGATSGGAPAVPDSEATDEAAPTVDAPIGETEAPATEAEAPAAEPAPQHDTATLQPAAQPADAAPQE